MPTIYVDADACPVKEEAIRVGQRHGFRVILVANGGLRPSREEGVETVIVGKGFDEADDWIATRAGAGDIVVTADVPLAERAVQGGALVTSHSGREFAPQNIGMARAMRDLTQTLREAGDIKGYNAPFSKADRSAFLQTLETLARRSRAMRQPD